MKTGDRATDFNPSDDSITESTRERNDGLDPVSEGITLLNTYF